MEQDIARNEEESYSEAEALRGLKAEQIGSEVVVDGEVRHVIDVPSPGTVSVVDEQGRVERVAAGDVGNRENADRLARLAELTELARRRGSETPELDAHEVLELENRKSGI